MNSSLRLVSKLGKGAVSSGAMAKRNFTDIPMGKRQAQQFKNWLPTLAVYGAACAVGGLYFTDWRVICDWIPFYNGKYKPDE